MRTEGPQRYLYLRVASPVYKGGILYLQWGLLCPHKGLPYVQRGLLYLYNDLLDIQRGFFYLERALIYLLRGIQYQQRAYDTYGGPSMPGGASYN